MPDSQPDTAIVFTGQRCCVFDKPNPKYAVLTMSLENIADYGSAYKNEDGSVRHWLYTWDEGSRMLKRCKKCGALFLVQFSEFHGPDDSYYTDWFQVDDEATAELINATWDGDAVEQHYEGPAILKTNGSYAFRNVE